GPVEGSRGRAGRLTRVGSSSSSKNDRIPLLCRHEKRQYYFPRLLRASVQLGGHLGRMGDLGQDRGLSVANQKSRWRPPSTQRCRLACPSDGCSIATASCADWAPGGSVSCGLRTTSTSTARLRSSASRSPTPTRPAPNARRSPQRVSSTPES